MSARCGISLFDGGDRGVHQTVEKLLNFFGHPGVFKGDPCLLGHNFDIGNRLRIEWANFTGEVGGRQEAFRCIFFAIDQLNDADNLMGNIKHRQGQHGTGLVGDPLIPAAIVTDFERVFFRV